MEARDVFLKALGEMLTAERTLAEEVLPQLLERVAETHFREVLEEHLEQTREHWATVDRVFLELGEESRPEPSAGLDGLRRQHEAITADIDASPLRDLVDAVAAAHTEHYEISAYHGLITLASILGEPKAVRLLEQNLHQEEEALEKLEKSIPERLTGELAPA